MTTHDEAPTPIEGDAPTPNLHPNPPPVKAKLGKILNTRKVRRRQPAGAAAKHAPEPEQLASKIRWYAEYGAESEDIATKLDLRERLATDTQFRVMFEKQVELGQASLRIELATKMANDAQQGKVTALSQMASAWLVKHQSEQEALEVMTGYADRLTALIEKINNRPNLLLAGEKKDPLG